MWRAILSAGDGARRGVLVHGLDGHGKNLLVPVGLEQRFGVGAVVLAPASIGPHEVRWEQDDVVSQPSERPCPEVSRAAGFEKHGGSALFGKKRYQLGSTHTELLGHLPRFSRDGNLEDVLCKIHSDRRTVAKRTSPAGACPPRCWNRPSCISSDSMWMPRPSRPRCSTLRRCKSSLRCVAF